MPVAAIIAAIAQLAPFAIQEITQLVTAAIALQQQGAISPAQLNQIWGAVGIDVQAANDAWDAAVKAHQAAEAAAKAAPPASPPA